MGSKINNIKRAFTTITLVVAAFVIAITPATEAIADAFDDQIRALEKEISRFQTEAGKLRAQSNSLKNELAALDAQKRALQKQIDAGQIRLAQINDRIADTKIRMFNQKELLGTIIRSIYLDSTISPIERVASSKSVSDYIDKQEYSNRISDQLQSLMDELKKLQEELDLQKKKAQNELESQNARKAALITQEVERANLLARTQGQEAAYQQISKQKTARIAELEAEQAAANASWGGNVHYEPRGGGYPSYWADPPKDSMLDDWLMYNRECVSYTAFRIGSSGRYQPTGFGNANQWDDNARSRGVPVDSNPRRGDVAVWNVGYYGHVMYVESVLGNGDLVISEYNFDFTGRYSLRTISKGTWQSQGLVFIHF